jgi:hypothetical protein
MSFANRYSLEKIICASLSMGQLLPETSLQLRLSLSKGVDGQRQEEQQHLGNKSFLGRDVVIYREFLITISELH